MISSIISTLVLVVIAFGLYHRKNMKFHIPAMLGAFVVDVLNVLYIEINRHAIETFIDSAQQPAGNGLILFHIGVSLLTIALYVVLTILGFKVLKGQRQLLKLHRNLAGVFVIARLTNYVTSFMV